MAANCSVHRGHRRQESMYTMTGLYAETPASGEEVTAAVTTAPSLSAVTCCHDTVIKCHSRNPSVGIVDRTEKEHPPFPSLEESRDCGILSLRPKFLQRFAGIKVFVLLISVLVLLQQALSSGYINSVITTIEKRFEIPSSLSGLIASSYEIGNVFTVIFVSYLGSQRHIPVWIGVGSVIMGIGSLVFVLPHFITEPHHASTIANASAENICRGISLREQDIGLGRLSSASLSAPPLAPHSTRIDNCIQGSPSTLVPVVLFVVSQLLLGCGGSPLFTLGTTYIDDHVCPDSALLYIGFMYSMAAFGPALGFLLGAYLLSFHMDSFTSTSITIDPEDQRWVGMWWGGFLLYSVLLVLVAIPFFAFPKILQREKGKIGLVKKPQLEGSRALPQLGRSGAARSHTNDTGYGHSVKEMHKCLDISGFWHLPGHFTSTFAQTYECLGIFITNLFMPDDRIDVLLYLLLTRCLHDSASLPYYFPESACMLFSRLQNIPRSMWRLVSNPLYIVTCLAACMELVIVSGFIVFLPKYLETQFSLGKSQASIFTGSVAIPGACIGIFMGGCLMQRLVLSPKGAVQFVMICSTICLVCYGFLFFLGCENVKMAGTTIPYFNSSKPEPFQVNLTAACNFGCECRTTDVEPVCGNNGLTYFSPCHAGCTTFSSSRANFSNCACIRANISGFLVTGSSPLTAAEFAEVIVVPVATAGPCNSLCRTIFPFLILLFFMTFIVAVTQMPLLMIVLRSVSEEERSFALGMQFVIFRLFGYIPAPILFGNLIDSTCLLWKSICGEKGGRCLLYDIEKFHFRYIGICAGIKTLALSMFAVDWWLVRQRLHSENQHQLTLGELIGSIISLDKLFEENPAGMLRSVSLLPSLTTKAHLSQNVQSRSLPRHQDINMKTIGVHGSRHTRSISA